MFLVKKKRGDEESFEKTAVCLDRVAKAVFCLVTPVVWFRLVRLRFL